MISWTIDYMHGFRILGSDLATISLAAQQFRFLVESFSRGSETICTELHIRDLNTLERIAEQIASNRFACYCWNEILDKSELDREEFRKLRGARFQFGYVTVQVEEKQNLPPRDWNEQPSSDATVRLSILERVAPSRELRGHNEMAQLCKILAESVMKEALEEPVTTVTVRTHEGPRHDYLIALPKEHVPLLLNRMMGALGLRKGVASLEFLGRASEIRAITNDGLYRFDSFPSEVWSLNSIRGKTPFALERGSFLCPIPNIVLSDLENVASSLTSAGAALVRWSFLKKYLKWHLGPNELSPPLQDNYLMVSEGPHDCGVSLGFDQQFSDDPPLQRYKGTVGKHIEMLGYRLRRDDK